MKKLIGYLNTFIGFFEIIVSLSLTFITVPNIKQITANLNADLPYNSLTVYSYPLAVFINGLITSFAGLASLYMTFKNKKDLAQIFNLVIFIINLILITMYVFFSSKRWGMVISLET